MSHAVGGRCQCHFYGLGLFMYTSVHSDLADRLFPNLSTWRMFCEKSVVRIRLLDGNCISVFFAVSADWF